MVFVNKWRQGLLFVGFVRQLKKSSWCERYTNSNEYRVKKLQGVMILMLNESCDVEGNEEDAGEISL